MLQLQNVCGKFLLKLNFIFYLGFDFMCPKYMHACMMCVSTCVCSNFEYWKKNNNMGELRNYHIPLKKSNIALFSHVFHIFYAKINKIRKDPTVLVRI